MLRYHHAVAAIALVASTAVAAPAPAGSVTGAVTIDGRKVALRYVYTRTASFIPAGESENMFRETRVLLSDRPLTPDQVVTHTQDGLPRAIGFTGVRIDIAQPGTKWVGLAIFNADGAGSHVEPADSGFVGLTMTGLNFANEAFAASVHTDAPHGNPYGAPGNYSFDVTFATPPIDLSH